MDYSKIAHPPEEVKNPNQATLPAALLVIRAPMELQAHHSRSMKPNLGIALQWMANTSPRKRALSSTFTAKRTTLARTCLVSGFSSSQTVWRRVDPGIIIEASPIPLINTENLYFSPEFQS